MRMQRRESFGSFRASPFVSASVIRPMLDVARRERLRRLIQSEASTADRLYAAVIASGLRKRASAVSVNIAAVEVFFLDAHRMPAHDEERWLDAAEHWLAVHTNVLRGLEFEAASNAVRGIDRLAAALRG